MPHRNGGVEGGGEGRGEGEGGSEGGQRHSKQQAASSDYETSALEVHAHNAYTHAHMHPCHVRTGMHTLTAILRRAP